MPRLLLLIPTTSYRTKDFLNAATKADIQVAIGTNDNEVANAFDKNGILSLSFANLENDVSIIIASNAHDPFINIIPVDETTCSLAAKASEALGLPHNPHHAVINTIRKDRFRKILAEAGFPVPKFEVIQASKNVQPIPKQLDFPIVLKPVSHSASQGVVRINTAQEFDTLYKRISKGFLGENLIIEEYWPGKEVALEGLLVGGKLTTLAVFEKPEPLTGPFFEETIYVTPSFRSKEELELISNTVERAANIIGLKEGAIHCELRLQTKTSKRANLGPWIVELAPRSIGGLCSRTLFFNKARTLEDLIISHSLNLEINPIKREENASGVMMIPIPKKGILKKYYGESEALSIKGITGLDISVKPGQVVIPLPEGNKYLGFIFAKGSSSKEVIKALKLSHSYLSFQIN